MLVTFRALCKPFFLSFLENTLLRSIPHFSGIICFLDFIFQFLCISLILTLYHIYFWQRFSPTWWASYSLNWWFPLLYRKFIVLWVSICQLLALIPKSVESYLESLFLFLYLIGYDYVSSNSFSISDFIMRPWIPL